MNRKYLVRLRTDNEESILRGKRRRYNRRNVNNKETKSKSIDRKVSNSDLSGTSKKEDLVPTSGSSNSDDIDDNN